MSGAPEAKRRLPFFYGWLMVGAAAVNGSFVLGSAQFSLSVFLVPMEEDLGWSRSTLFFALALRQLFGGLLGPLIGPLIDRELAPRFIMPAGALMLGASLMAVRWVESPLWFLLTYGVMGSLAFAMLNSTMWESVVLKWFVRKRARAMVWTSFGTASASMIFPLLTTLLIFLFGWRDAWLWYGVITIVLLLPAGLTVRTRPERMGLLPDGEVLSEPYADGEGTTATSASLETSLTRADALHTSSFWLIGTAYMLTGFAITGFQSHWVPYFQDIGFGAGIAAAAVSTYGASNVASRVFWAWASTRLSIHTLIVGQSIAAGLGVGFVLLVRDPVWLFAWAVYQGFVLGSYNYLHGLMTAEYYGRMHIGAIRGLMLPSAAVARAGSAVALSMMRELSGNYKLAFLSTWAVWLVVTTTVWFARKPRKD
jgi:OFA family oxalate/formate antiporter-like MFS transporter